MIANAKFAVFGAGAVGGYFGALLVQAGHSVAFIARGAHGHAIRTNGLRIESPSGNFTISAAEVTDNPADIGPVDAVILGVKAWQVRDSARAMVPLLSPATKVLSLQNGVEAAVELAHILGREHTLVGVCRIINSVVAPGVIRHAGLQPTIALGEPDDSALSVNAAALADALNAAGVTVNTPPDIHVALWEKMVFIAAASGVGAVARATIGEVRECNELHLLLRQLMEEVATVARARGVYLTEDVINRTQSFVAGMPHDATTSMQRDIIEGRPSELEAIVGAITRLGREKKVPTPGMDYVYASLLPQEKRARDAVGQ
jgi:2-dehydropantoate 2-reductase